MWQLLCGMIVYKNMDVKQLIRGVVRHGLRPSWPAWVPREYRWARVAAVTTERFTKSAGLVV